MKFTFPPESRPLEGYTIKRAIHRGGFGEVYYGITDAGREVALKLLQNNSEIELRGIQQCLNLSHPNLVTIFDVRRDEDGDHWIIMEYVAGETLDAAIRRHPQGMPVETVRKWLPGILAGGAFLHSRGLVHRDLKPANIFMADGNVKVGDVGLSKFITPSRRSAQTQSVGTVYYMAPEVAKGRYGQSVDIYAAGIILYEMLTGQVPFNGESTGEILMKHLTEQPDLQKLPPRLRNVVARCLYKEPEQRFATLSEIGVAFDNAVFGREQPEANGQKFGHHAAAASGGAIPVSQKSAGFAGHPGYGGSHPHAWQWPCASATRPWFFPLAIILLMIVLGSMFFGVATKLSFLEIFIIGIVGFFVVRYLKRRGAFAAMVPPPATAASPPPAAASTPPPVPPAMQTVKATDPPLSAKLVRVHPVGKWCRSAFLVVPLTALLVGLLVLLMPSMFTLTGHGHVDVEAICAFGLTAILGSWILLAIPHVGGMFGKRWRRSRLSFAFSGVLLGIVAAALHRFLMIDLMVPTVGRIDALWERIGEQPLLTAGVGPTVMGFAVFFAALFAVRDWSELIRPFRDRQFSSWAVIVTVFMAWLVSKIFAFPPYWAMSWALVLASTVQLVSNWEPRGRRIQRMN